MEVYVLYSVEVVWDGWKVVCEGKEQEGLNYNGEWYVDTASIYR